DAAIEAPRVPRWWRRALIMRRMSCGEHRISKDVTQPARERPPREGCGACHDQRDDDEARRMGSHRVVREADGRDRDSDRHGDRDVADSKAGVRLTGEERLHVDELDEWQRYGSDCDGEREMRRDVQRITPESAEHRGMYRARWNQRARRDA